MSDVPETRYAVTPDGAHIATRWFTDRGVHTLKGVPDDWQLHRVEV